MSEVVLITGANGMLAQQLAQHLKLDYSIRFLSRNKSKGNTYQWDIENKYIDPKALTGVDHIIHLAGASIAQKRWTKKRKEEILSSRIDSAKLIQEKLNEHKVKITSFISASAIGYYGTITTNEIFKEESQKGNDFLSDVCNKWETIANSFDVNKIANRTIVVRIGLILSKQGGILDKLINTIKYYLGTGLGNGNQYMPWIHIQDLCGIFKFVLDNKDICGTFNAISPEHLTNKEFTNGIAKALNRKIILPNIPKFIVRVLFGEMSVILLEGSRVSSKKIIKNGFNFKYNNLSNALSSILKD